MISAWHLLWIVPLTAIISVMFMCVCIVGRSSDE